MRSTNGDGRDVKTTKHKHEVTLSHMASHKEVPENEGHPIIGNIGVGK